MTNLTTDYTERIRDWADFCQSVYRVESTEAKLIAMALLGNGPNSTAQPLWLLVNSDDGMFWSHLSSVCLKQGWLDPMPEYMEVSVGPGVHNLAWLRKKRPRVHNENYNGWLRRRNKPLLMIDTEWERPRAEWGKPLSIKSEYGSAFIGQFLRGTATPAGCTADFTEAQREMTRLLRLVLDHEFRRVWPKPVRINNTLEVYLQLCRKLNPELDNQAAVWQNAAIVPGLHAALYGRQEVEERDWVMLSWLMRTGVPDWTKRILEVFLVGGYFTIDEIGLRAGQSRTTVLGELSRLQEEELIDWPENAWKGRRKVLVGMNKKWYMDLRMLMEGTMRWW